MDQIQIDSLQDYQHLGIDMTVLPDLSENEDLAAEEQCLIQDLLNGWFQPKGIADGTADGAEWGFDIRGQLNRGFTRDALFALKVAMETQANRDDRVQACVVQLTATDTGRLIIDATVAVGYPAYPFSFRCTTNTVGDLWVESLGS